MLQLWARTGAWLDRVDLAFGAGPYAYFDTQTSSNTEGYDDHHGVGLILSGAVSYSLTHNWFAVLQINQIVAPGSVGTRTLLLGTGYRLEEFLEKLTRASDAGASAGVSAAANEVGVFGGITVVNTLTSERSTNFGLEYRHRGARHVELSASLLDEGDGLDGRHLGVTGEGWLVQEFAARRLVLGLGLGPYVALQDYHAADGRTAARVVGLASMTASWRLSRSLALRIAWHRGITGDDQDRDIVTAGVAWRY